MPDDGQYLSVEDAARYLTLSPHYLRRLTSRQRVPFAKIGKRVVFDSSSSTGGSAGGPSCRGAGRWRRRDEEGKVRAGSCSWRVLCPSPNHGPSER